MKDLQPQEIVSSKTVTEVEFADGRKFRIETLNPFNEISMETKYETEDYRPGLSSHYDYYSEVRTKEFIMILEMKWDDSLADGNGYFAVYDTAKGWDGETLV